ncbi:MAG: glycosyltransferase family 39 protein [Planctomycetes bacterium]|nr:glycosyltransferase family 39 protein [Planctomycetota bacterium]
MADATQDAGGGAVWRLLALLAFAAALTAGALGLDFGKHWDEWQHVDAAYTALETGRPLPMFYNYPSLTFDLTWIAIGAQVTLARALRDGDGDVTAWRHDYIERRHEALQLRTRALFLVLSLASGLLLFVLARDLAGPRVAVLASALLLGSHEFLYHARFIAPDGPLATCAVLCFAGLVAASRSGRLRGLVLAAVAAGLATSAKYTGVFLVLPVMLAGPLLRVGTSRRWLRAAGLAALAGAVFLVTTPGALLETGKLLEHVRMQQEVYAEGHRVYTVDAGWDHARHVLEYLGTQLFERWPALDLALALLACMGLVAAIRRRPRFVLLLASGLLPYLALLVAHRVFIVRNLLPLVPFVALACAAGIALVIGALPVRARRAASVAAALLAAGLLARRVDDGAQILEHGGDPSYAYRLAAEDLDAHPELAVYVADDVRRQMKKFGIRVASAVGDPDAAERALVLPQRFPSTSPSLIERWYGVPDVNYRYYHSWHQRKPALISVDLAREYDELAR